MPTSVVDTYSGGIAGETRQMSLNASKIVQKIPEDSTGWNATLPHATGTKLCVGIRYMLKGTANVTGNPVLALGLCNGDDTDNEGNVLNAYGDATTNHAIGIVTKAATFTYTGGPPAYFTASATNGVNVFKKVDTTQTEYNQGGGSVTYYIPGGTGSGNVRGFCAAQLHKTGAAAWTINFVRNDATGQIGDDLTNANFNTLMTDNHGSASVTGYGSLGSYASVTANEASDGNLDCVFCYWDKTAADIIVCDIAVTRIS